MWDKKDTREVNCGVCYSVKVTVHTNPETFVETSEFSDKYGNPICKECNKKLMEAAEEEKRVVKLTPEEQRAEKKEKLRENMKEGIEEVKMIVEVAMEVVTENEELIEQFSDMVFNCAKKSAAKASTEYVNNLIAGVKQLTDAGFTTEEAVQLLSK